MTAIPGVGPQLARAAAGTDPRGILVFDSLPDALQRQEDSTAAADHARASGESFPYVELRDRGGSMWVPVDPPTGRAAFEPDSVAARDALQAAGRLRLGRTGWRSFVRDATDAERQLLEHLGHDELPELLYTYVNYRTTARAGSGRSPGPPSTPVTAGPTWIGQKPRDPKPKNATPQSVRSSPARPRR